GADRECAQIEIACGAGGAPARVFAFGGDEPDLDRDLAIIESWDTHVEVVADLERSYQVLPQIEVDPHVVQVNESYQWHARRYIFARLNVALVGLGSHWCVDHHLVDDRLHGRDVSRSFLHRGCGDLALFFGVAVYRLVVGRFSLIHRTLALMQSIGRLVEPCN